jgi:hypothetical protein
MTWRALSTRPYAADHNGVNSGVWLVRNSPWTMWFLDELWQGLV